MQIRLERDCQSLPKEQLFEGVLRHWPCWQEIWRTLKIYQMKACPLIPISLILSRKFLAPEDSNNHSLQDANAQGKAAAQGWAPLLLCGTDQPWLCQSSHSPLPQDTQWTSTLAISVRLWSEIDWGRACACACARKGELGSAADGCTSGLLLLQLFWDLVLHIRAAPVGVHPAAWCRFGASLAVLSLCGLSTLYLPILNPSSSARWVCRAVGEAAKGNFIMLFVILGGYPCECLEMCEKEGFPLSLNALLYTLQFH